MLLEMALSFVFKVEGSTFCVFVCKLEVETYARASHFDHCQGCFKEVVVRLQRFTVMVCYRQEHIYHHLLQIWPCLLFISWKAISTG